MRPINILVTLFFSAAIFMALQQPNPTFAEPFIDLYVGGTSTQKADADMHVNGGGNTTFQKLKFDNSVTGGARLGLWLPQLPYVGFAIDGFYFTSNQPPQQMRVCSGGFCTNLNNPEATDQSHLGVGLDLMLRAPIGRNENFPNGRFAPYLTVGPALFFSSLDMPDFSQARSVTLGFKGGAGAKIMLTKTVGLFGEYRLTHFKPEYDFQAGSISGTLSNTLTTHHFVAGLSIAF